MTAARFGVAAGVIGWLCRGRVEPVRSRHDSTGRLAFSGVSLKPVESARACEKPAMPIGQMALSAPPASITSASSIAIIRAASPIECAPVEQAVTTA